MENMDLRLLGKNVVVLGGAGFVGRSMVNQLSKQGFHVKVVVRRADRHRDFLLFPQTQLHEMRNITEEGLTELFKDTDIVVNLFADMTAKTENMPHEEMLETIKLVKKTIEESNVQRFLSLSQIGASASDESNAYSYMLGKVDELVMATAKAGVTIAQPSMLIGMGDQTTAIISKQMRIQSFVLPVVNPKTEVQPLAVRDFAEAFVSTIRNEAMIGRKLILAGDTRLSIKELASMIKEMMGVKPAFIYPMCNIGANINAKLGRLSIMKSISENFVVTFKKDLITDVKFGEQYGFEPGSLEQTLISYVVDPSMREKYNNFRKEAGRNVEDLV